MKEIVTKHHHEKYQLIVQRILVYGFLYYTDLGYRKKIINKIRNRHLREKKIAKLGQKEVNRYHNYLVSCKKRILKDRTHGACAICKTWKPRAEISVDHIIPVKLGGKSEKSNMQILCKDCHRAKTHKDNGTKPKLSTRKF